MTLQEIVDRLNDQCPLLDNRAKLLVEISEVENLFDDIPTAFVLRTSDAPTESDGMGPLTVQQNTRTFAVLLMAETPTENAEPMEALRKEVWQALLTWSPDDTIIEYAGGEAQPPSGGIARWQESFNYVEYLRYQRP